MNSERLRVSVIIPALNAAGTLQQALDSLAGQDVAYEAILVDGGSRDETVAIAACAPALRVVSAPGTSIYEALNRGIAEAEAPSVVLLNADDALLPGALAALADALARAPDAGIVRGRPRFVERSGDGQLMVLEQAERQTARPMDLRMMLLGPCAINSLCIRREVFDRVGCFDPVYRLSGDRDWLVRVWAAGVAIAEIEQPVYQYLSHAGSSTLDRAQRNYAQMRRENIAIAERYFMRSLRERPSSKLMRALRRWHAVETAMLALRQARDRQWRELGATLRRSFAAAPLWPVGLVVEVLIRAAIRLRPAPAAVR